MNTQRKEEQFSIDGLARVRVTNIRGSVLIQAGCTGEIRVEVAVDPESGDPDRTQVELTQLPDGTVVAETRFSKGLTDLLGGRRDRSCRVDFHLRVPPACEVTLDAVSSTAALQGLEGHMDLQTVSGDLTLQDMQGTLRVKTISGAVRITAFAGDLHLQTVSGQVNVGASRLHSLQGTTVSGDVRLGGHLEGGPYRMESVSADFTLDPPPEASLHLRLETLSGQLIIPAPLAAHRPRPGWQEARILGGRVEVHLTSISGDLRLPSSGTSAGDDQATGERLDMLDKIKKGELSVDEALESLSD